MDNLTKKIQSEFGGILILIQNGICFVSYTTVAPKGAFFIPSFSDYPTFTMVRIMNATKQIIVWGGGSLDEY